MNRRYLTLSFLIACAVVAGCSSTPPKETPPPAPPVALKPHALGEAISAGPYTVTLVTQPKAPNAGDVTLAATVKKGTQPVDDATLTGTLVMTSMDMGETNLAFQNSKGGNYSAKANISMAGDWEIRLTIKPLTGDSQSAAIRLTASP